MSKLAAKKMKLENGEYSEDEALKECFEKVNSKTMSKDDYNKFREYKRRFKNKSLGTVGKEKVLKHFGFILVGKAYTK